jgi:hypothetical protein
LESDKTVVSYVTQVARRPPPAVVVRPNDQTTGEVIFLPIRETPTTEWCELQHFECIEAEIVTVNPSWPLGDQGAHYTRRRKLDGHCVSAKGWQSGQPTSQALCRFRLFDMSRCRSAYCGLIGDIMKAPTKELAQVMAALTIAFACENDFVPIWGAGSNPYDPHEFGFRNALAEDHPLRSRVPERSALHRLDPADFLSYVDIVRAIHADKGIALHCEEGQEIWISAGRRLQVVIEAFLSIPPAELLQSI